jgi:hypothetical protein
MSKTRTLWSARRTWQEATSALVSGKACERLLVPSDTSTRITYQLESTQRARMLPAAHRAPFPISGVCRLSPLSCVYRVQVNPRPSLPYDE